MKRTIAYLMVILTVFLLAGCGQTAVQQPNTVPEEAVSEETLKEQEMTEMLVGTWVYYDDIDAADVLKKAEFRADGTWTLDGQEAAWHFGDFSTPEELWIETDLTDKDGQTIYISRIPINDGTELWLNIDGRYAFREDRMAEAEITAENFGDYYELCEDTEWVKNAFDEDIGVQISWYLRPKEGLHILPFSDYAVEWYIERGDNCTYNVDFENKTYELVGYKKKISTADMPSNQRFAPSGISIFSHDNEIYLCRSVIEIDGFCFDTLLNYTITRAQGKIVYMK